MKKIRTKNNEEYFLYYSINTDNSIMNEDEDGRHKIINLQHLSEEEKTFLKKLESKCIKTFIRFSKITNNEKYISKKIIKQ